MANKTKPPAKPKAALKMGQKADPPPTHRKRDEVDPKLICKEPRTRKPTERALAQAASTQRKAQGKVMRQETLPSIDEQSEAEQVTDNDVADVEEDAQSKCGDSEYISSPSPVDEAEIMAELAAIAPEFAAKNDDIEYMSDSEHVKAPTKCRRGDAGNRKPVPVKKATVRKAAEKVLELPVLLRFRIPSMNKNGTELSRFLDLDYNGTTLDIARNRVFEIIGCSDVPKVNLPDLMCQISKDKGQNYDLSDWTNIRERYSAIYGAEKIRKAGDPSTIVIDILLSPANYLKSLHLSRQLQNKGVSKSGVGKGKNAPVQNLFATDNSAIGGSQRTPAYLKLERDLAHELSKCIAHEDYCKIDKYNKHRTISDQQFRAWVEALADHEHDPNEVSLLKSPKQSIFEPWRVDIKSIEPSVPTRKARGDSAPPVPYGQTAQVPMPNFFLMDPSTMKYFGQQHDSSLSPDRSDRHYKKRQHSASGSETEEDVVTVQAWLGEISKRPEAKYLDMWQLESKFEEADFLNVPLSFLRSLPKDDMDSLKRSLKERAFVLQYLTPKGKKKKGKYE
ncbi:hypothetical protein M422DRAFT_244131 [Sphaerobolus stellatus SS14]|nr:hypothetical protein M422DRAFT_244131 [Sphaerobolus stellatus SS14]